MKLLEGVVREHHPVSFSRYLKDERIAPAHRTGRRDYDLVSQYCSIKLLALGCIDPVSEGGVYHHGHRFEFIFGQDGRDSLVKLPEAGKGASFSGDVGSVDH